MRQMNSVQLGGPFTHEPDQLYNKEKDEFHESLSSGARRLIEKAFEDIVMSTCSKSKLLQYSC